MYQLHGFDPTTYESLNQTFKTAKDVVNAVEVGLELMAPTEIMQLTIKKVQK